MGSGPAEKEIVRILARISLSANKETGVRWTVVGCRSLMIPIWSVV